MIHNGHNHQLMVYNCWINSYQLLFVVCIIGHDGSECLWIITSWLFTITKANQHWEIQSINHRLSWFESISCSMTSRWGVAYQAPLVNWPSWVIDGWRLLRGQWPTHNCNDGQQWSVKIDNDRWLVNNSPSTINWKSTNNHPRQSDGTTTSNQRGGETTMAGQPMQQLKGARESTSF